MTRSTPPPLLRPVLRIADRPRTATRLGVVVLALLVPGALATGMYTAETTADISFSSREAEGADALCPVLTALADTVAGRTPDLAAVRAAELEATGTEVPEIGDGSVPARIATTTALTALAGEIGNRSNLILDPDLDSFYVMDAQVVQVPRILMTALETARPGDTARAAVLAGRLSNAAEALRADVGAATAHSSDPGRTGPITAPAEQLAGQVDALAQRLTATLDRPVPADPAAVAEAAAAAIGPLHEALSGLLEARISTFTVERRWC